MLGLGTLAKRLFGSSNERRLKAYWPLVDTINGLEGEFAALTDDELRGQTALFRQNLIDGMSLDELLPRAFATVREAAKRTLGQRHFDVQLVGGMVLHEGNISEMKTGEGKTLVATLPVYLNALEGKGVHVVTVNDYLAARDAEWMGQIYNFLGLEVGCIIHGLDKAERQKAYAADVTYGTNNEFGFDYLRDNMEYSLPAMVQRGHNFAIVDEVDSILIDEARTPLIISGPTADQSEMYMLLDTFIPELVEADYEIDEKAKSVTLTEEGNEHIEELLRKKDMLEGDNLYDIQNVSIVHHVNQALRAHMLFTKDVDYIVKDAQVIIIDEFTGRMMEGRRYSEGLHQALEAKEEATIQPENQTLASITFQNYFRLYTKLAGMTGTALTEAAEFEDIYKLQVIEIPTNLPIARKDEDDEVYRTTEEKLTAIVQQIEECHERGQPILVGTVSIEKSETLAKRLKKKKIKHNVLNARYHEQEAQIIGMAGVPGGVTIATNMAGRGTDIQLGGNLDMIIAQECGDMEEGQKRGATIARITADINDKKSQALEAGGLYVLCTERHESRRIDNQLRGRTGRQGDPGASKFYLSLEDDLMRIFGSERMDSMLQKLGLEEGEAIVHPWINKALEKAQQKVEVRNFDIRKNLLKYDDVMNDQRKAIFEQRIEMMKTEDVNDIIADMRHQVTEDLISAHIPEKAYAEQWDVDGLKTEVTEIFGLDLAIDAWAKEEGIADQEILERLEHEADRFMAERAANFGPEVMRYLEKEILLRTIDSSWREHLAQLDHLRQTVGLRGYAQRNPLNEYKTEAFAMFENLLSRLRTDVTRQLAQVQIMVDQPPIQERTPLPTHEIHTDPLTGANEVSDEAPSGGPPHAKPAFNPVDPATWGKVPRNSICPCGSNKKYKHCHGSPTYAPDTATV